MLFFRNVVRGFSLVPLTMMPSSVIARLTKSAEAISWWGNEIAALCSQ